jgi:rSAM/selenodomain-associated transferase 1
MNPTARPPEAALVAVFAKAPVPGAVKTRLAATLGDEEAAQLHARLVRHTLATAVESDAGAVELWCAPDERHEFFAGCAREFGIPLRRQRGADLGERMEHAVRQAHEAGRGIVLIGTDCPALAGSHLRLAAHALRANDVVLIPAEDGGYVLVACAKPVAGMFGGIAWGTGDVMAQTRERLAAAGAKWIELPPLWDVDRPADLERLEREGWLAEARP